MKSRNTPSLMRQLQTPINVIQRKQDNGKYEVVFSYQSSTAKEVELFSPDLHERLVLNATDELQKFQKKEGTNIFSLQINDVPENTNFTYSITVTNNKNKEITIVDPNNILYLYKYDTKSGLTDSEPQEISYVQIPTTPEIKPEWSEIEPPQQTNRSITSEKFPDPKKPQDATYSFPNRDVWIYIPDGFNELDNKEKILLFILDGQSFCETLTPYIDAMRQDEKYKDVFSNTAVVFVNPGEYETRINRVIEYYFKEEGNHLYLMSELPDNISDEKYKNAYIFIKETSRLFYISNGLAEEVKIDDTEKFNKTLTEIMGENTDKHLYEKEVNNLITSNGGHTQKENEKADKFSSYLANKIIPTYCARFGVQNDNVILAGHSLVVYPVLNATANYPQKVGGVILFSAALNQNYKTDLPENAPKGSRLEKIPIYMQIGQLEDQIATEFSVKKKDMENDKSRLEANQEFHKKLSEHGYNVSKTLTTFPSGHSELHVIDGIVDGLRFVNRPKQQKELEHGSEKEKSQTPSDDITVPKMT